MCPLLSQVQAVPFEHEQGGRSKLMVLLAPSVPAVHVSLVLTQDASAALSSQLQVAVLNGV